MKDVLTERNELEKRPVARATARALCGDSGWGLPHLMEGEVFVRELESEPGLMIALAHGERVESVGTKIYVIQKQHRPFWRFWR